MRKLLFVAGAGIGFVLGSMAGRQPYDLLESKIRKVKARPDVQEAVDKVTDAVQQQASKVTDAVEQQAGEVTDKLHQRLSDVTDKLVAKVPSASGSKGNGTS